MKTIPCFLFLCSLAAFAHGQPWPDSVRIKYIAAKTDKEKGYQLMSYIKRQPLTDTGTKADILRLKTWFELQQDEIGINYTNLGLAYTLTKSGDYPAALDLLFSALPKFEKRKDSFGIWNIYNIIGATYMGAKDYMKAAEYSKREIAFAATDTDRNLLARIYNGIACVYGEGKMPDSGMVYAERAVKMDEANRNLKQLAVSTSSLGENYIAAGQYDIALPFLRRTANYYRQYGAVSAYLDAYLKNDFAEVFFNTHLNDSANYYARQALLVAVPFNIKDQSLRSYEYLYKSFEQTDQQDSLNKYFRLAMLTKDSLFTIEKIKSIQSLSFREEMRQQEIAAEKQKVEEERHQNIQYALIALGIVIFITVFLLLSRTIIVNEKLISFFAILGLLIVFEFINLLIHPWLAHFTHESPVLMLMALVTIAALLIPLHHRLEHWIKEKMIEKNNLIRLTVAKKTIERLGKRS
jgi:tetratricopeptide (TPR) repeat protein